MDYENFSEHGRTVLASVLLLLSSELFPQQDNMVISNFTFVLLWFKRHNGNRIFTF